VEAAVESHHSNSLVLSRLWHDRQTTHAAPRGELFMKVLDAMYLVGGVDSEGDAVQRLAADDAAEAARVVRSTRGSQDTVQDGAHTHGTLLQGVEVASFTERLPIKSVERFAL